MAKKRGLQGGIHKPIDADDLRQAKTGPRHLDESDPVTAPNFEISASLRAMHHPTQGSDDDGPPSRGEVPVAGPGEVAPAARATIVPERWGGPP